MDSNKAVKPNNLKKNMRASVRSIVEFIFREGDIDNRFGRSTSTEAMLEGTRIHKKIQNSQGGNYQAEVPLRLTMEEEKYVLTIDGRADGIFTEEFQKFLPEEGDIRPEDRSVDDKVTEAFQTSPVEENRGEMQEEELSLFDFLQDGNSSNAEKSSEADEVSEIYASPRPEDLSQALRPTFVWIDEIKGIYNKLDRMENPIYVHLAQAKCYAYMYAVLHNESYMGVQMTYCNMDTEEIRRFRYTYTFADLQAWFDALWKEYRKWADYTCEWEQIRQASIKKMEFPFEYREGQKALAQDVYRTILRKKNLFIQAPTGVGKTITTLFPAIKAVGEELADRIFYLTAKTVTATVARDTFALLEEGGYRAKTVQLTAKEKVCLCGEEIPENDAETRKQDDSGKSAGFYGGVRGECNPVNCPYAKGHFDRINDAIYDLLTSQGQFTREVIREQARKFMVCPFELSLDLSSFSDNVICDYNYVFDPRVALKRFFGEGMKGNYLFLIDEAHNLADRSREMYSAALYKEDFLAVKKLTENKKIKKELDKCNKVLLEYKRECEGYQIHEDIGPFLLPLERLAADLDELLQKPEDIPNRKEILEFYFNIRNFLYVYDLVTEKYVIYSEIQEDSRFMLKLFCVDPSENLQSYLDKGRSAVFFSATLLPVNYYKSLLSTKEDNYAIYAHSSFSPDQQLILIGNDVSTKYTRRTEKEFRRYAEYIRVITGAKKGNYMVFSPSYKVMEQVYEAFCTIMDEAENILNESIGSCKNAEGSESAEINRLADPGRTVAEMKGINISEKKQISYGDKILPGGIHCIVQSQYMKETQREAFLAEFEHEGDYTLIAFCIMGGIFGEGIDLKNERLIGTIIAGTGLPQVCSEREILKNYYDGNGKNGFDYAYRYPGMNKVLQAAGRVIRTESDTGVIALLDERFLQEEYTVLFPREWENRRGAGIRNVRTWTKRFWEEKTP